MKASLEFGAPGSHGHFALHLVEVETENASEIVLSPTFLPKAIQKLKDLSLHLEVLILLQFFQTIHFQIQGTVNISS